MKTVLIAGPLVLITIAGLFVMKGFAYDEKGMTAMSCYELYEHSEAVNDLPTATTAMTLFHDNGCNPNELGGTIMIQITCAQIMLEESVGNAFVGKHADAEEFAYLEALKKALHCL